MATAKTMATWGEMRELGRQWPGTREWQRIEIRGSGMRINSVLPLQQRVTCRVNQASRPHLISNLDKRKGKRQKSYLPSSINWCMISSLVTDTSAMLTALRLTRTNRSNLTTFAIWLILSHLWKRVPLIFNVKFLSRLMLTCSTHERIQFPVVC